MRGAFSSDSSPADCSDVCSLLGLLSSSASIMVVAIFFETIKQAALFVQEGVFWPTILNTNFVQQCL